MSFQDYIQGLEHISIKVTPLRLKGAKTLGDVLCPDPAMFEPISEKTELRDLAYSECIKKILYSEAMRHRESRLKAY